MLQTSRTGDSVRLTSGPADVLATGVVIAFQQSPLRFEFVAPTERGGEQMVLQVSFRDDESRSESEIEVNVHDSQNAELSLVNWKSPLGAGTAKPLPLATLGGRLLLAHFRVYTLQDSDRTLFYTFYLG